MAGTGRRCRLRKANAGTGGENVQVSSDRAKLTHNECVVAAAPGNPKLLFAGSMVWTHADGQSVVGYSSHDGGLTWRQGFEQIATKGGERVNDPTIAFGPGGELYFACMRYGPDKQAVAGNPQKRPEALDFYLSKDCGITWAHTHRRSEMIDRPWLAVDTTMGKFRGRVYCTGNLEAPVFLASDDGAKVFLRADTPDPAKTVNCRPSNPVVLSDGAVLFTYRRVLGNDAYRPLGGIEMSGNQRPSSPVFVTSDGGKTTKALPPVNALWRHKRLGSNASIALDFPQLAVDPPDSPHRDRLHCVWADGNYYPQRRVIYSQSSDKGKSWSAPVVLSEQPMVDDDSGDFFAYMPCVAVNRVGVVAVTWYDRRGLPPKRDGDYIGWNVRGRVSSDGMSWGPSFAVNDKPSRGEMDVGHTAGLAADSDGRFHAVWIDDRTGRGQVWSSSITASGE